MNGTIYKITCMVNGMCYIGQTFRPVIFRWSSHKNGFSNQPLYDDIKKYGVDMFKFEVLHEGITCPKMLDELEIALIDAHDSYKNGYNQQPGGSGSGAYLTEAWDNQKEICSLYTEKEMTQTDIGKMYGVSRETISDILKANSVKKRPKNSWQKQNPNKHVSWQYADQICFDYTELQMTLEQIAEKYNATAPTIASILESNGIKRKKKPL